MESDRHTGASSVAEIMEEDSHKGKRALVQLCSGILVSIGLLFTGYMNFSLYSRAFTDDLRILGLIPAFLIEGSLAVFLIGGLLWFSAGIQGMLAKIFGWAMFGIVALNTIIEFNTLTGNSAQSSDFLKLYAFWGVPLVLVVTIGFWKAVIDSDPSVQIMRTKRRIQQSLTVARMDALVAALGHEDSRQALAMFGDRAAEEINRRLRGLDVIDGQAHIITPPARTQPSANGHKPDGAANVVLAKDAPEEEAQPEVVKAGSPKGRQK